MCFLSFGYSVSVWGCLPRDWYTSYSCSSSLRAGEKSKFTNLVLLMLRPLTVTTSYVKHVLGRIYVFF